MDYFKVTNPLPSLYHIEDPRGVFVSLIVGTERAFLIDTAMGIGDLADLIRSITKLPLIVVNTHGHPDHTLGNYQFSRVYLSKDDWEIAVNSNSSDVRQRIISMSNLIPTGFSKDSFLDYNYDNLLGLNEGEIFDLGGLSIETISLGGHTKGSMGFLCREMNILFSGDSIAPIVFLVFPESSDITEYIDMLERVKSYKFTKILSAHTDRLIPKSEIDLYIDCAESFNPEKSMNYRTALFPEYAGRLFSYKSPANKGEHAIIVC